MDSEKGIEPLTIARATDSDREWAARLMAGTEPWITLGRGLEQCRARCNAPDLLLFICRRGSEASGFICCRTGAWRLGYAVLAELEDYVIRGRDWRIPYIEARGSGGTRTSRLSTMSWHRPFSSPSRGIDTVQDATARAPSRHITRPQITSPSGFGSLRRSSKSTLSSEAVLVATRFRGGPPHAPMNSVAYSRTRTGQLLLSASAGIARMYARD